jgi:hypothetical protein
MLLYRVSNNYILTRNLSIPAKNGIIIAAQIWGSAHLFLPLRITGTRFPERTS